MGNIECSSRNNNDIIKKSLANFQLKIITTTLRLYTVITYLMSEHQI